MLGDVSATGYILPMSRETVATARAPAPRKMPAAMWRASLDTIGETNAVARAPAQSELLAAKAACFFEKPDVSPRCLSGPLQTKFASANSFEALSEWTEEFPELGSEPVGAQKPMRPLAAMAPSPRDNLGGGAGRKLSERARRTILLTVIPRSSSRRCLRARREGTK